LYELFDQLREFWAIPMIQACSATSENRYSSRSPYAAKR